MLRKAVSLLICFCFIFEQAGFAQMAPSLGIPAYLNNLPPLTDRFRPLQMRALTFDPIEGQFGLYLDKGDEKDPKQAVYDTDSQALMEYFQIGLRLPNSAFWVNLRPDSPQNIIDADLEKTDLGRVMLEADLQLKKDISLLTSPDTAEGRQYWNKIYEKIDALYGPEEDLEIPTMARPWIVPGEIIVGEAPDGVYIYKATLNVMLEQDYLKDQQQVFSDSRVKELNDYSAQLIRQTLIPKLVKSVNSSRKYAALRQVYYSLILAQWFKQRHAQAQQLDSRDLSGLTSKSSWSKQSYFDAYRKSFSEGEYHKEEQVNSPYGIYVRQYVSGGMVLGLAQNMAAGLENFMVVRMSQEKIVDHLLGADPINRKYSTLRLLLESPTGQNKRLAEDVRDGFISGEEGVREKISRLVQGDSATPGLLRALNDLAITVSDRGWVKMNAILEVFSETKIAENKDLTEATKTAEFLEQLNKKSDSMKFAQVAGFFAGGLFYYQSQRQSRKSGQELFEEWVRAWEFWIALNELLPSTTTPAEALKQFIPDADSSKAGPRDFGYARKTVPEIMHSQLSPIAAIMNLRLFAQQYLQEKGLLNSPAGVAVLEMVDSYLAQNNSGGGSEGILRLLDQVMQADPRGESRERAENILQDKTATDTLYGEIIPNNVRQLLAIPEQLKENKKLSGDEYNIAVNKFIEVQNEYAVYGKKTHEVSEEIRKELMALGGERDRIKMLAESGDILQATVLMAKSMRAEGKEEELQKWQDRCAFIESIYAQKLHKITGLVTDTFEQQDAAQKNKLEGFLRNPAFQEEMARYLNKAYNESKNINEPFERAAIATNIAGFLALETGIGILLSHPNRKRQTIKQVLEDIINERLPQEEREELMRLANLSWKTSQPFRGGADPAAKIRGENFILWDNLPAEVKEDDWIQIKAAAKKLHEAMDARDGGENEEEEINELRGRQIMFLRAENRRFAENKDPRKSKTQRFFEPFADLGLALADKFNNLFTKSYSLQEIANYYFELYKGTEGFYGVEIRDNNGDLFRDDRGEPLGSQYYRYSLTWTGDLVDNTGRLISQDYEAVIKKRSQDFFEFKAEDNVYLLVDRKLRRQLRRGMLDGGEVEEAIMLAEDIAKASSFTDQVRESSEKLGKAMAKIVLAGEKIPADSIASALRLFSIGFTPYAIRSSENSAIVSSGFLKELPGFNKERCPIQPPVFHARQISQISVSDGKELQMMLRDAVTVTKLGRTLVFKTRAGEMVALKFLSQGEDPGKLSYESDYFAFMNALKQNKQELQGEYPQPRMIDGESTVRLPKNLRVNGKTLEDLLIQQQTKPAQAEDSRTIDESDGNYTIMAYVAPDGYFTYLHEVSGEEDFIEASRKNMNDLFVLARYGLIHPDIIELFHNQQTASERSDAGRYLWDVGRMQPPMLAGRIEAWEATVAYPNNRKSGIADFAELVSVDELIDLSHPFSKHFEGLSELSPEERTKIILAHYMGNYFLSWAMICGRRANMLKKEQIEHAWDSGRLREALKEVFSAGYQSFSGQSDTAVLGLVDWDLLAKQMKYFMSGEYVGSFERNVTPKGYYAPNTEVESLLHVDFLNNEIRNWQWKKGWAENGQDADLGSFNSAMPIQELIKANYVFTMLMLGEKARQQQEGSSARRDGGDRSKDKAPERTGKEFYEQLIEDLEIMHKNSRKRDGGKEAEVYTVKHEAFTDWGDGRTQLSAYDKDGDRVATLRLFYSLRSEKPWKTEIPIIAITTDKQISPAEFKNLVTISGFFIDQSRISDANKFRKEKAPYVRELAGKELAASLESLPGSAEDLHAIIITNRQDKNVSLILPEPGESENVQDIKDAQDVVYNEYVSEFDLDGYLRGLEPDRRRTTQELYSQLKEIKRQAKVPVNRGGQATLEQNAQKRDGGLKTGDEKAFRDALKNKEIKAVFVEISPWKIVNSINISRTDPSETEDAIDPRLVMDARQVDQQLELDLMARDEAFKQLKLRFGLSREVIESLVELKIIESPNVRAIPADSLSVKYTFELVLREDEGPSGNIRDGGTLKDIGGIDLRALPLTIQPGAPEIDMQLLNTLAQNSNIKDVDGEWQLIQQQFEREAMPYQRIKEYVAVCCAQNKQEKLGVISSFISDVLRLEEENALATAPELKELLVLVESLSIARSEIANKGRPDTGLSA